MADKNIGALPQVPQLMDDSLMVVEQQGQAMKMTGRQFREFGKQAVMAEVQELVDAAETAAESAVGAVKAVTDMTVEAEALETGQEAAVVKSIKNGVVNLAFGLPRGRQGEPGAEGRPGPRGPKGDPGTGLKILGYYDTLAALEAAVPAPEPGDPYGVGTAAPYDIYVFDGVTGTWKNNGPLTGGGGGTILPENVVTAEGGAGLAFAVGLGDAPQTVTFTDEEEPPLTAEDILYSGEETVGEAITGLFTSVGDGKQAVASAITDMGVPTAQDAAFSEMAENIRSISAGADTSDATASPGDILAPKTAYTASGKVQGIIPALAGQTIVPGTADKTLAGGQYLSGTQTIKGDRNLTPANIRQGVSLFGVAGAMTSEFKASLTVTADTGAVVTATHTNGAEVSGLSTNGSVTLELPIEGEWTVTAVRGMAQYNSVVINVTSSYQAALTAEVHIVRVGAITPLREGRYNLSAASNRNYAIFSSGQLKSGEFSDNFTAAVDAYDKDLTRVDVDLNYTTDRSETAAVSVGEYVLVGGGNTFDDEQVSLVYAYNSSLTRSEPAKLSAARKWLSAASIGSFAIFGGGYSKGAVAAADSYNDKLERTTPVALISARYRLAAASNQNYALFAGGVSSNAAASAIVDAYNTSLTRSTPVALGIARNSLSATRAGNYVLFAGGISAGSELTDTVDAYDLFLTRTTPMSGLSSGKHSMAAATLSDYAVIAGGSNSTSVSVSGTPSNVLDVYDPYLTKTTPDPLQTGRYNFAAAAIGNFALFGGGKSFGDPHSTVEAYQHV